MHVGRFERVFAPEYDAERALVRKRSGGATRLKGITRTRRGFIREMDDLLWQQFALRLREDPPVGATPTEVGE